MEELPAPARDRALLSLVGARALYAYNWYNVGPIQLAVAAGLAVSFGTVSEALSLFLVGVGLFQVPAGMLSLRWGARRTSLLGIALMSVAAVGSAFAPTFLLFLGSRFLVGLGAALFFSPAIGLVARYYRQGGQGFAIGLYNGAFNLGAGIAVFVAALLSSWIGWRGSLLLGGLLLGAVTVENLLVLPRLPEPTVPYPAIAAQTRAVLKERELWVLGSAFLGFWVAEFAIAQYYVPWAVTVLHLSPAVAGGMDAVLVISSVVGGPLGGWLAERVRHPTRLMALSAGVTALAAAAIPFAPAWTLWGLSAVYGTFVGVVFAGIYLMAAQLPRISQERIPLAVGLVNGIQVSVGSLVVVGLGTTVFGAQDYTAGFLALALLTVLPLPLLLGQRVPLPLGPSPPAGPAHA